MKILWTASIAPSIADCSPWTRAAMSIRSVLTTHCCKNEKNNNKYIFLHWGLIMLNGYPCTYGGQQKMLENKKCWSFQIQRNRQSLTILNDVSPYPWYDFSVQYVNNNSIICAKFRFIICNYIYNSLRNADLHSSHSEVVTFSSWHVSL